jgi:cell shape-determining protein MreD
MSSILFIPMLYLAAVAQTWFASRWDAFGVGPNLLVLAGFLWLTQTSSRRGLLVAALAGLVSDLNSPLPLGFNLALFASVAYAVIWLRRLVNLDGFAAPLGIVWFAATGITLWQGLFLKFFEHMSTGWGVLIERSALVGLYTMCVAAPMLIFVFWRRRPQNRFA